MKRQFIPSADPPIEQKEPAWWFIFYKHKLLVSGEGREPTIPFIHSLIDLGLHSLGETYLGTLDGKHCYAATLSDSTAAPTDMFFQDLRQLYGRLNQELIHLSFRALHLLNWSQKTRFCKHCGWEMGKKAGQQARECPNCGYMSFPRISPAVIVLVERGETCLLARSPRFQDGFYSVLAGFAEPGETLEETVEREVREETGIAVADIRYFGSQPWPFPDSLMIAFTARYAGGEIRVDGTEILDAQWFTCDQLPKIPGKISIARNLIDWFIAKQQRQ
jgi:NAD+ diphosphatase